LKVDMNMIKMHEFDLERDTIHINSRQEAGVHLCMHTQYTTCCWKE
jgi:hypothetical protein